MTKRNRILTVAAGLFFALASIGGSARTLLAQKPMSDMPKNVKDEAERAQQAAAVLTAVMTMPDQGIPQDLMNRATAVAVIPHVVKGAFGIGGSFGKGLVSQRAATGGWSAPSYIDISGGSFGFQIGVESTDLVLVFTNDSGVKALLEGKVKLGADADVAAGPVGRSAQAGTDATMRSAIYSYSRSKGLFAGLALDGAVVSIDNEANHKVYGNDLDAKAILLHGREHVNKVVTPFVDSLEKYAAHRTSNH